MIIKTIPYIPITPTTIKKFNITDINQQPKNETVQKKNKIAMIIIKDEGPLLETVVIEPELPRRQVRTQNQDKCNMTVIDDNCYPY